MQVASHPEQTLQRTEPAEPRIDRLRRHGRHTGLYVWAFVLVALLVVVIALAAANTREVQVSWVAGTGHASLVWIIVAATVIGWLLGIVTATVFRYRTRRPRQAEARGDAR
jgi:uncharacterized integral membrane protein